MPPEYLAISDIAIFSRESIDLDKQTVVEYLDTGNIIEGKIQNLIQYTDYNKLPTRARKTVAYGDIIFSTVRPNNLHYGIIRCDCKNLVVSTGFSVIRANQKKVLPEYLYYLLTSKSTIELLQSIAEQSVSAYPSINDSDIGNLKFKIPSIAWQQIVVNIIEPIENKIRINQAINDNLQEQKRLAFKQLWDSLEQDHVVSLETIAHLQKQMWKPSDKQELLEHYSIPAFDDNQYPSFDESSTIQSNKTVVLPNSILVSKLNPETKRVWRPLCMTQNAVCSTEFLSIIPDDLDYAQYIYSVIDSEDYNYYLINNATGSTGSRQRVLPSIAMQFELPLPSKNTVKQYSLLADAIDQQIRTNTLEMQSLKNLKNYLLPKLMSGEIDVSTLKMPTKYSFNPANK